MLTVDVVHFYYNIGAFSWSVFVPKYDLMSQKLTDLCFCLPDSSAKVYV